MELDIRYAVEDDLSYIDHLQKKMQRTYPSILKLFLKERQKTTESFWL